MKVSDDRNERLELINNKCSGISPIRETDIPPPHTQHVRATRTG